MTIGFEMLMDRMDSEVLKSIMMIESQTVSIDKGINPKVRMITNMTVNGKVNSQQFV